MHVATSPAFKDNAHQALADAGLQKALARSGPSFIFAGWARGYVPMVLAGAPPNRPD